LHFAICGDTIHHIDGYLYSEIWIYLRKAAWAGMKFPFLETWNGQTELEEVVGDTWHRYFDVPGGP